MLQKPRSERGRALLRSGPCSGNVEGNCIRKRMRACKARTLQAPSTDGCDTCNIRPMAYSAAAAWNEPCQLL